MSGSTWLEQNVPASSPAWQTLSTSYLIPNLPYMSAETIKSNRYSCRDFYYDFAKSSEITATFKSIFADIIGFSYPEVTVRIPAGGGLCLYTRVLSTIAPSKLTIIPESSRSSVVMIYATKLDHQVTCLVGSNPPFTLDIDPSRNQCGAQILMSQGNVTVKYMDKWDPLEISSPELTKTLTTQLRVASILFWVRPPVAQAIASHVARVTGNSISGAMLNINANALGQQLLASAVAGHEVNYAPTLTLELYKKTVQSALDVAATYEEQYNRFSDRKVSAGDQLAAFDAMIAKAQDVVSFQSKLANDAFLRWTSACDTLMRAETSLRASQLVLRDKEAFFKVGLEMWKTHKAMEAAFTVITAVLTFAVAIGEMCIGDPAGVAAAPAAIESAASTVSTSINVAKAVSATFQTVNKATMTKLKTTLASSLALYDSTTKVVAMTKAVEKDRTVTPALLTEDDSVLRKYGMDDIATLAAWEEWSLQVDAQMQWTVSEQVEFAPAYRLALQKHAIEGRLVTQAQTQAIKAGQEYSTLAISNQIAQADLQRLQTVRATFQSESDAAETTRASFFDQLMMIKTGVLIEMQKAALAYKYLSLTDSRVSLDPTKSVVDLRADALLLSQEVERWQEQSSSDFSPFTPTPMLATEISPSLAQNMVAALKANATATFTLSPTTLVGAAGMATPGPFVDGSRFRIQGMRAYLIGAKVKTPAPNGSGTVTLSLTTSGLYADIWRGTISNFMMTPLARSFKYSMAAGSTGVTGVTVVIDSYIPSHDYVEPTPFSQWCITIRQPELLDLSNLIDVKFEWQGSARFDV